MLHALRSRPKRDPIREQVLKLLKRGGRWTGAEMARAVGHPFASSTVTAKARELRNAGHTIKCRRFPEEERGNGYVYRYWLEA